MSQSIANTPMEHRNNSASGHAPVYYGDVIKSSYNYSLQKRQDDEAKRQHDQATRPAYNWLSGSQASLQTRRSDEAPRRTDFPSPDRPTASWEGNTATGSSNQQNGHIITQNFNDYSPETRRSDEALPNRQRIERFLKAAAEGQTLRVQHFLELDKHKHLVEHSEDGSGYTALHHATLSGFKDTVDALLAAGADVSPSSVKHGTPLHLAAVKERANVVDLLLEKRAVVHHLSEALGLPLHCAAFSGNRSIADALTRKGARLEASAKVSIREMQRVSMREMERFGNSLEHASNFDDPGDAVEVYECQPFIVAILRQSMDIVEKCMDSNPCIEQEFQIHHPIVAQWIPPLMFSAGCGLETVCEALLRKRASRTKTNSYGWNAVTHAAYMGHTACIQVLLDDSGDDGRRSAQHRDNQGWTPLMHAACNSQVDTVEELLRREVPVDQPGEVPGTTTTACSSKPPGWDWRQRGLTALHVAAYQGHVEVVRKLVAAGASWNIRTEEGNTPVDAAGGNRDVLAFTLERT